MTETATEQQTEFERILAAVRLVANANELFTSDDVWTVLPFVPASRSCVGKAFGEAARLRWSTELFVKSTRPEAKGRRVQQWRRGTNTA